MSKLFKKTLVTMILMFGIIACSVSLFSGWLVYDKLIQENKAKAIALTSNVAASSLEVFLNRDTATIQSIVDQCLELEGISYVLVVYEDGEILAHTFAPKVPDKLRALIGSPRSSKHDVEVSNINLKGLGDYLDISSPILAGVAGYVHVGMNLGAIKSYIWSSILYIQLITFLIFLFSVAAAYLFINSISKPLIQLTEYANKVAARDFSAPMDIRAGDEVGLLAKTMKNMAGEIRNLITGLEETVQDATQQLQEALAYVSAIIRNLADGLVVLDTDGSVTRFNPALADIFGFQGDATGSKASELLGQEAAIFLDERRKTLAKYYERQGYSAGEGGDIQDIGYPMATENTVELTATRRDGTSLPVELSVSVVKLKGAWHCIGIVRDITRRKRAEEAIKTAQEGLERRVQERTLELSHANRLLKQEISDRERAETELKRAEEKYRGIFENALEGIFQTTPEGKFLSANPAIARILGYDSPEDLIFHVDDVATQHYVDPERRHRMVELMVTDKSVRAYEVQQRRTDDRLIWCSINARAITDGRGDLVYIEGLLQDITERKAAEEALRESEERYRSLVENINIGVTLVDSEFRVVATNAAHTKIFGATPLEAVGQRCYSVFPGEDKVCPYCPGTIALATSSPSEIDTAFVKPDGSRIQLRIRAFPTFGTDGRPTGFIEVVEDITERVQFEDQLRHSTKMEAIGQLAGGVAHDFNNLLTAIIGYASILLQEIPKNDILREKVLQISRAADRAAELTGKLLAFSRKQVLNTTILNLNPLIVDFEKILQRLLGERIELVTSLEPRLGPVSADPTQIEQILMNLAINARDAMPNGGRLILETSNVVLDEAFVRSTNEVTPGRYARFSVTDSGDGMDPEIMSQVFNPFFTTKEPGQGTGLGLSMVYGIVKQHQGHITVESKPGHGTVFKVYLPRVDRDPAKDTKESSKQDRITGKETVLLVEDEPIVRDLAREALELLGYTVLEAGRPSEAIELSKNHPGHIDLILTDVVLPQMDGRKLYEAISPDRPSMRVIFMSGYTEDAIVHHGVLDSDVNFLPKPFTVERLARKVRRVLEEPGD